MKKIFISLIIIFAVSGCSFNSHVAISVKNLDVKSIDGNVKKWVDNNSAANGIYLAKTTGTEEGDIYYLYMNYKNTPENKYYSCGLGSINSGENNGIEINTFSNMSDEKSDKINEMLFCITAKDSNLKYIILNGEKIKESSIASI